MRGRDDGGGQQHRGSGGDRAGDAPAISPSVKTGSPISQARKDGARERRCDEAVHRGPRQLASPGRSSARNHANSGSSLPWMPETICARKPRIPADPYDARARKRADRRRRASRPGRPPPPDTPGASGGHATSTSRAAAARMDGGRRSRSVRPIHQKKAEQASDDQQKRRAGGPSRRPATAPARASRSRAGRR